jgi:hypothetical protein
MERSKASGGCSWSAAEKAGREEQGTGDFIPFAVDAPGFQQETREEQWGLESKASDTRGYEGNIRFVREEPYLDRYSQSFF